MSNPLLVGALSVIPQTLGKRPVTIPTSSVPALMIPPSLWNVATSLAPTPSATVTSALCFITNAFAAPSNDTSHPS